MKASSFVQRLPANYIPIIYSHGYRGNAVNRILSAHQECAFQQPGDPLSWSGYWVKEPWQTDKTAQMTAHGHLGIEFNHNEFDRRGQGSQSILRTLQRREARLVFFQLHPVSYLNEHTLVRPFVWLYSTDAAAIHTRFVEIFNSPEIDFKVVDSALDLPHVCNINVANLFNLDYDIFITEYKHCCSSLHLTPEIDRVRAFILRYLERERLATINER